MMDQSSQQVVVRRGAEGSFSREWHARSSAPIPNQLGRATAPGVLGSTPSLANRPRPIPIRRRSPRGIGRDEHDARAGSIQVISRAAEMLRLLQAHPSGLSQAEIGERLGMARSTISRLLNTLEDEGLVASHTARGPYRLGPEIARMASTLRLSVAMDVHPFMEELSRQLEETVDLSILDQERASFVDQVISSHRLRAISAVGESLPLHCCANGKAMLATLPPEKQAEILPKRLARLTPNTITTPAALRKELDRIRLDGVAFDREEQTEGVCAVGAVLRGLPDQLVAVSVPVPTKRFLDRKHELTDALLCWVDRVNTWFAGP
jgi:DNA-binding IclR family transcriptional regulator